MSSQATGAATKRRGTLTVSLAHNVTSEQLHQALDRILNFAGCTHCGLQGIDLRLAVGDPAPDQLKGAGVAGAVFNAE